MVRFCYVNVGGISDNCKRTAILDSAKLYDISILVETQINKNNSNLFLKIEREYPGNIIATHNTRYDGICILTNPKTNVKIKEMTIIQAGSIIKVDIEVSNQTYQLIACYLPANNRKLQLEYLDKINHLIDPSKNNIVVGDFNLDLIRDTSRYPTNTQQMKILINNHNLYNPNVLSEPTHYSTSHSTKSQIDYFLIDNSLRSNIKEIHIIKPKWSNLKNYHCQISIQLHTDKQWHCKPYWKFNDELLKNQIFTEAMKEVIPTILTLNISYEDLHITIQRQLFIL